MPDSSLTPARNYADGIGEAVANRTINRKVKNFYKEPRTQTIVLDRVDGQSLDKRVEEHCKLEGLIVSNYTVLHGDDRSVEIDVTVIGEQYVESWADVANRVASGNASLTPMQFEEEFGPLHHHLRQASLLTSGRHLQHGDDNQALRNIEVFSNCSTSAASFVSFYLLLNGSGVGRAYDDDMMVVDWRNMPIVVPVINGAHPDAVSGEIVAPSREEALHLYEGAGTIETFLVPDSREGWAYAIEKIETLAFCGKRNRVLLVDFSDVRERGRPIGGMQDRPASGPGPLIHAIEKIAQIRDSSMKPWRATMFVDHYLSECVLVGGARRAARMSTKTWRDKTIFEFIDLKRGGFLWTSNNSVTVDQEFWTVAKADKHPTRRMHARQVFDAVCRASYKQGTGEPGFINQDKLVANDDGIAQYVDGKFAKSERFKMSDISQEMYALLARRSITSKSGSMITNPCGEIALYKLGGYCTIADVVPYHATSDDDAEDAFRTAARFLIRVNTMDAFYGREVGRTNRIGVSMTGIHEYAWSRFGFGWKDLVDEQKSLPFWNMLSRFKRAVVEEAASYSAELGLKTPHTDTTIKPAGTTSKLFGLTEGAHLPSMREYLRWVQFRSDDPLIEKYQDLGYPVKHLRSYQGTTVVGFPTRPEICALGMGDKLVTAPEATPQEQYQWLKLLEKYYIRGVDESGQPLQHDTGNQVSYTLKYFPARVSYDQYREVVLENQAQVKCCSVMPQVDIESLAYEYQPEQAVTKDEFEHIAQEIRRCVESDKARPSEDISFEHVDCAGGACPVDFSAKSAAA